MDEAIITFINKYIPLTEEEANIIKEQNLFRQYRKNEILLAENETARSCFMVMKGCVRSYYLKNGEERNTDFFFENDTIRPVSYQTGEPSAYYLACLEDCILAIGNEQANKTLLDKVPKLASLVLQLNEDLFLKKTLELDQFKNSSPEERYLQLLQQKPDHLERIPLYHLASYLGITQISLSRIRSRISKK